MAGRPSLNARSLEALGAARQAALLLEHTQGNAAARRALRLAVAEVRGPADQAPQVALELLWCFLDLANALLDRVDDSED